MEAIPGLEILPDSKDADVIVTPICYFYEHRMMKQLQKDCW